MESVANSIAVHVIKGLHRSFINTFPIFQTYKLKENVKHIYNNNYTHIIFIVLYNTISKFSSLKKYLKLFQL